MKRILFILTVLFLFPLTFLLSSEKFTKKINYKKFSFGNRFLYKKRVHSIHQIYLPSINLYSSDVKDDKQINSNEKDNSKKENIIMKDVNWGWFKAKNRLEKLLIALGIIFTSIGLPFFVTGLVNILVPSNAFTQIYQNLNYSFIGVGSALLVASPSMIIVGSIRIKLKKKKTPKDNKTEDDTTPNSTNDNSKKENPSTDNSTTELE